MRVVLAILALCSPAYGELLHFENTTGVDWQTQPIDVRLPAEQQTGDSGILAVSSGTAISVVGSDPWQIAYYGNPSAFPPSAAFVYDIYDWTNATQIINAGGVSTRGYTGAILRILEDDGYHYGYVVSDQWPNQVTGAQPTRGIVRWGYQTRPGLVHNANLPEPSALWLAALAGCFVFSFRVRGR